MKLIEDGRLTNKFNYPIGSNMENVIDYSKIFAEHILAQTAEAVANNNGPLKLNFLCRGSSGAIIGGIVSSLIAEERACVVSHIKKPGESSHSDHIPIDINCYTIIIDDFICSGSTVEAIHEAYTDAGGDTVDMMIVSSEVEAWSDISFLDELKVLVCGYTDEDFKDNNKGIIE